jgi:hypothetical protein
LPEGLRWPSGTSRQGPYQFLKTLRRSFLREEDSNGDAEAPDTRFQLRILIVRVSRDT